MRKDVSFHDLLFRRSPIRDQIGLSGVFITLQIFGGSGLTRTLAQIDDSLRGATIESCPAALIAAGLSKANNRHQATVL